MLYILLAIISSSCVAVFLKIADLLGCDRMKVASFNYLSAFATALFLLFTDGFNPETGGSAFTLIFKNPSNFFFIWSTFTGLAGGVMYLLGFLSIQSSIRENGVALTGALSKLGVVLPVVLSYFLFKEQMSLLKTNGVLLSMAAVFFLSLPSKKEKLRKKTTLIILWVLLATGLAEFSNKLFENYAPEIYKNLFLATVFATAFLLSAVMGGFRKTEKLKKNALAGFVVGIPNLFSSFFLISSFRQYPAAVAFSFYSVGSILLITVAGAVFFKEKISAKKFVSLTAISLSLILMNL
ncbi:hypothetical protein JXL83_09280 [candidate division WOR-3 bacterium]|nr:hypothetical protein [candidate division WOR-3 bacterium]